MTTKAKKAKVKKTKVRPSDKIKFHASAAFALMTNKQGTGITDNQLATIAKLQKKSTEYLELTKKEKSDFEELSQLTDEELTKTKRTRLNKIREKKNTLKTLTETEQAELDRLIAKRDAPFELSETAKKLVQKMWLRYEYDYVEPDIITNELLKGKICEQDSFSVADRQLPSKSFRIANRENLTKGRFIGKPDVILEEDQIVDEFKTSWSLRTHINAKDLSPVYLCQRQVYLFLTGLPVSRLVRVLVSTPEVLLKSERSKIWNKLKKFEDTEFEKEYFEEMYQKEVAKLEKMHNVDHIPEEDRIKVHTVKFDADYMKELERRAEFACDYYDTLTLSDIEDV